MTDYDEICVNKFTSSAPSFPEGLILSLKKAFDIQSNAFFKEIVIERINPEKQYRG